MNIDEAKRQILAVWRARRQSTQPATWQEKFDFYSWLQRERSELLSFNCSGDKWQRICGWLS
ncbi:hypothetical protein [Luteimonas sp. MC1825]|uniref:hypothetical protein n=1 Tax=Luteimonas sp. MC1825 TaxID=2761107 RepID=UPI001607FB45|nr:hypothetical protein [Luteimonas sp. MC1825]MBB6600648.1 hypothetical protein [Luteimonas sp. MC1825]QOC88245.1 hypothetical protein IDM46_00225 [Luteimonas sp. MC1825]